MMTFEETPGGKLPESFPVEYITEDRRLSPMKRSLPQYPHQATAIVQNNIAFNAGQFQQSDRVTHLPPANFDFSQQQRQLPLNVPFQYHMHQRSAMDNAKVHSRTPGHGVQHFSNVQFQHNGEFQNVEPMFYANKFNPSQTKDASNIYNVSHHPMGQPAMQFASGHNFSAIPHSTGVFVEPENLQNEYSSMWTRKRVTPVGLKETLKKEVDENVQASGVVDKKFPVSLNTALKSSTEEGTEEITTQVHKKFLIAANRYYMGSSKYKGVCYNKKKQKWRARISNSGKREFLGDWDSEVEAALIYDARVKQLFSSMDNLRERLNFPDGLTKIEKNTGDEKEVVDSEKGLVP